MINYYKKAWKIAGSLRKYQYARLTTILWVLAVIYEFYILITYDYAGLGSLGAIIANIFEAIVITIVLCLLTYVNSRFFPWAKVRLPIQGIDKPVFQDMTESGEEIYRDTLSRGPQATPDFDISTSTTEVEDPEVTPTNVPYSVRQNIKAKYGNNYDVYRSTGNGTPTNVSETADIQRKYGSQYGVYSKRPTRTRTATTFNFGLNWRQESQAELKARARGDKWGMEISVFLMHTVVAPLLDTMVNFVVWPFSFLIGAYKMRSIVKDQSNK